MVGGEESFDIDVLDRALGFTDSPVTFQDTSETIRINPDDRSAIDKIATQQPTGVTITPSAAAPAVPEYMAPYIPAKEETKAPADTDWNQQWKQTFGSEPDAAVNVNQDAFEQEQARRDAYANFMDAQPQLADLRTIATGTDELAIVQQAVRQTLADKGLNSPHFYDAEIAEYIKDGVLTDKGVQRASTEKQLAQQAITHLETKANEFAGQVTEKVDAYFNALTTLATTFKPFGLTLPETFTADVNAAIRSGQVDAYYAQQRTPEELAEHDYWRAINAIPSLRAELMRLQDERGQKYGANKRLASLTS